MKYEEIKEIIKSLAKGQGFYGRLYKHLEEVENQEYGYTKENFEDLKNELEKQNFKDDLDVIFYFES